MARIDNKIDLVFDFLILQNELTDKEKFIKKIKDILFENFKEEWKKKNQKFDFSFSFKDLNFGGLRFSYNNFGEKEIFYDKAIKVFRLFEKEYSLEKLEEILDSLDSKNAAFQTTIGFEWKNTDKLPRFKIYFEEIHHGTSKISRLELVKKIAKIIKFDCRRLGVGKDDSIGAICVDFLPKKETQLKVYLMSDKVDLIYLNQIFIGRKYLMKSVEDFLDIFSKEKLCFYYTARRFGKEGLDSVKVYKIYEVGGIKDFSMSYEEIFRFLKQSKLKKEVKKMKELMKFALKNKIMFYPVISSMDLAIIGEVKTDLYLSFRV